MRLIKMISFLLCLALTAAVVFSCKPKKPSENVTSDTTGQETETEALLSEETEASSENLTGEESTPSESPTEEEPTMPVEPLEISERYFIFRIWNFEIMTLSAFKNVVDTVAATIILQDFLDSRRGS